MTEASGAEKGKRTAGRLSYRSAVMYEAAPSSARGPVICCGGNASRSTALLPPAFIRRDRATPRRHRWMTAFGSRSGFLSKAEGSDLDRHFALKSPFSSLV